MSGIAAQISKDRDRAQGVGSHHDPVKYLNQDFNELRAQLLASGKLFEDEKFPTSSSSLGETNEIIVWKRPSEITKDPQFIVGAATREDIKQGRVGNCWFLCSLASLTMNETFLTLVLPLDQSFQDNYAGIFHFRFFRFGEWVDIVVDDRLPTENNVLYYMKSETVTEFWSPLLEKAYAKFTAQDSQLRANGSYRSLKGGFVEEALVDFTAGFCETFVLNEQDETFFQKIRDSLRSNLLVTCSTPILQMASAYEVLRSVHAPGGGSREVVVAKGHAQSVTGAEEVLYNNTTVKLIRYRNPWGFSEWNGAWSDKAPEWDKVSKEVKNALWKDKDDGESWLPYILREREGPEVLVLILVSISQNLYEEWNLLNFHGSWKAGSTAGGNTTLATYWTNPQFQIKLEGVSRHGDSQDGRCVFSSGLWVVHREMHGPSPSLCSPVYGKASLRAGVRQIKDDCLNCREICKCFELPTGRYLVVPFTENAGEEADFCIRVFTENKAGALEARQLVKLDEFKPPEVKENVPVESETCPGELENEVEELSAQTLNAKLNAIFKERTDVKSNGFCLDTCKRMVKLMDKSATLDLTGTLSIKEYVALKEKLEFYTNIFSLVDTNLSGTIDSLEMGNALQNAGT
ncbi:calpain-2 catalytic subunit [Pelobates cultripes]|uniref:Calpain-2 catalytic subunit n=1 Tax=Pelobates cultripes TaxID=61616 RepID=A0AAD1RIE8_PELCU|nr:calpain-2 catalytic subunit [Pelobates cultripes]